MDVGATVAQINYFITTTFMTHFKKSATTVCVSEGGTQDSICVPKD
jgi:hypothetical protein